MTVGTVSPFRRLYWTCSVIWRFQPLGCAGPVGVEQRVLQGVGAGIVVEESGRRGGVYRDLCVCWKE